MTGADGSPVSPFRAALYRVRMRDDSGEVTAFRITASDGASAAARMCAMEGAPPSAVLSVEELRVIHDPAIPESSHPESSHPESSDRGSSVPGV